MSRRGWGVMLDETGYAIDRLSSVCLVKHELISLSTPPGRPSASTPLACLWLWSQRSPSSVSPPPCPPSLKGLGKLAPIAASLPSHPSSYPEDNNRNNCRFRAANWRATSSQGFALLPLLNFLLHELTIQSGELFPLFLIATALDHHHPHMSD